MFNNNGGYSLSDIAAATGNNGHNSGNGWGDGNGAWQDLSAKGKSQD